MIQALEIFDLLYLLALPCLFLLMFCALYVFYMIALWLIKRDAKQRVHEYALHEYAREKQDESDRDWEEKKNKRAV